MLATGLEVFGGSDRLRPLRRKALAGVAILLLMLLLGTACERKKKPTVPPQATAPTISVPPTAQAGQQPAPPVQRTPPPATSAETGVTPRSSTGPSAAQPKPRNGRSSARKKLATPPPAAATAPAQPQSQKPGGPETAQVQIGVQVPQGTAQNTEQLLQTAENNLGRVTRALSDGEQAMLRQARTYVSQSRTATREGDPERAYNLALKANLLSIELAK